MKTNSKKIVIASLIVAFIAAVVIVFFLMSGSSSTVYAEHLELSQKYLDELEYDLAIAELEKAIELEPKKVEAYIALADIYMEMGESDKAEEILQQAAKVMEEAKLQEESTEIDVKIKEVKAEIEAKNSELGDTGAVASNTNANSQETAKNESTNAKEVIEDTQVVDENVKNLARTETIYLEKGRYYVDEYNALGLKVKRSEYNKAGILKNWQEYEYDADGKKIRMISYYGNGVAEYWEIFEYDEIGNLVSSKEYKDELLTELMVTNLYNTDELVETSVYLILYENWIWWEEFEYDVSGKLIKSYYCTDEGFVTEKLYDMDEDIKSEQEHFEGQSQSESVYEYNENGDLQEVLVNGIVENSYSITEYDVYERKTKITKEDQYVGLRITILEYDENNSLIKESYYRDEALTLLAYVCEYDAMGNEIRESVYNEEGKVTYVREYNNKRALIRRLEYEYDEEGELDKWFEEMDGITIYYDKFSKKLYTFETLEQGNKKYIGYDVNENPNRWGIYEYEGLKLVRAIFYTDSTLSMRDYEFEYDEDEKRILQILYDEEGTPEYWTVYKYSEDVLMQTLWYKDAELTELYCVQEYDKEGNLISEKNIQ